jgi:hypothetical protein
VDKDTEPGDYLSIQKVDDLAPVAVRQAVQFVVQLVGKGAVECADVAATEHLVAGRLQEPSPPG